jgi:conjugal transfer/entry exclusion protein
VTSYERLGSLSEARGDTAKALAAYDQVAALWGGADAELQSVVTAARKRAMALRAGRGVAAR